MSDEEKTIECTRRDCGCEIVLNKDNLIITRPEVPLLAAKCPECSKTRMLTKELSIELVALYFEGELEDMLDPEMCEEGPLMPSEDLSKTVEDTLILLGYKGKLWKDKVKAIIEFVRSSATYQNPQGLHQLLAAWKVDSRHIPMIIEKVFGEPVCQNTTPQYNIPGSPGLAPPHYQGLGGAPPAQLGGGYSMAQTPQGQIVVIPPPTPPVSSSKSNDSDDTIIIEEKLGKGGQVTSRVIKQKANQAMAPEPERNSSIDDFASMLGVMKDLGVLGKEPEPVPEPAPMSPEIMQTLDKISSVLAGMSNNQSSARVDREERVSDSDNQHQIELKALSDEIARMREDKHTAEMNSFRDEIRALRDSKNTNTGLNDFQFEVGSKQQNLQMITGAVESTGNKIIEPLIEMQKQQAQLNGLFAIRQLETDDRVPAGTYIGALAPKKEVPDDEVSDTLAAWRARAGSSDQNDMLGESADDKF